MFKTTLLYGLLIAAGTAYNIEDNNIIFDNLIDYEESVPIGDISVPYPYQINGDNIVYYEPRPQNAHKVKVALIPAEPPKVEEDGASQTGLVATITSLAFSLTKKAFTFIISNAPALVISILTALGICNFTPVCSKASSLQSLIEVSSELESFATPERIARATDFVNTAIRKYRSLQNSNN